MYSHKTIFDALCDALMNTRKPCAFFRALRESDQLKALFPELEACIGVEQNPVHHPEGDVFEHTMLVLDCAAALREQARQPLHFMLAALTHDLGKVSATMRNPDGRIVAYGHEVDGVPLCERMLRRLTKQADLIEYAKNMTWLHMRPNMLARANSRKKKTRQMFGLSVCPEDLILLSRADASGKLDMPYDEAVEKWLWERLQDYRQVMQRPIVTEADLIEAGMTPGTELTHWLNRARELHFSGLEKPRALDMVLKEAHKCRN